MTIYNYEELFEDIPGDPDNILLKLPDEILESNGWQAGDTIEIEVIDGAIHLRKKDGTN
jgi:hypothetical protein